MEIKVFSDTLNVDSMCLDVLSDISKLQLHKKSNKNFLFQKVKDLSYKNSFKKAVFEAMLSHAYTCESASTGSFEVFFKFLAKKKNQDFFIEPFPLSKENSLKLLETFSDLNIKNLVFEALTIAGLEGKIALSKETTETTDLIEVSHGCFFPELKPEFNLNFSKFFNSKVVCIDGYIESISEIHRLLQDASDSQENLILFVRGLSNDVLHTLKVNYDRKSLNVIPVIVKFDIDGANLLNDIAIASCCDVVSSNKGQLISSIDIKSASRVDFLDISSFGVLIENKSSKNNIDFHVKSLQNKILNSENFATVEALTKRIQRLGMNRVTIKLVDDENKNKKSLMIDRSLKAIKMASTYGVVKLEEDYIPASSFFAGEYYAKKFKTFLEDLGAIIV